MSLLRLQIASDWHTEFHADQGISFLDTLDATDVDVLILAGDARNARHTAATEDFVTRLAKKYPQVLYVPGNHEFYDTDPERAWEMLKKVERSFDNVHIMRDEVVVIQGRRFLGGTMWFPPGFNNRAEELMNDFTCIKGFKPWVYEQHAHFLSFIEQNAKPDDIVITHHLPSKKSIPPKHAHSFLNPFFAVDLDGLIKKARPHMWIHGHTHNSMDYLLGSTRIVCNPLSYPHEINRDYKDKLVIAC